MTRTTSNGRTVMRQRAQAAIGAGGKSYPDDLVQMLANRLELVGEDSLVLCDEVDLLVGALQRTRDALRKAHEACAGSEAYAVAEALRGPLTAADLILDGSPIGPVVLINVPTIKGVTGQDSLHQLAHQTAGPRCFKCRRPIPEFAPEDIGGRYCKICRSA